MKLSAKSRYAIRALIDLAANCGGAPVSIKEIAERQKISERYLENIFNSLRKQGILKSSQGKGGGFQLNRAPEEIDLLQVIESLEGELRIADCVGTTSCSAMNECYAHDLWNNLNGKVKESFSRIRIKDIL